MNDSDRRWWLEFGALMAVLLSLGFLIGWVVGPLGTLPSAAFALGWGALGWGAVHLAGLDGRRLEDDGEADRA